MAIVTRPATDEYRDGWSRIFGKKEKPNACRIYNTTCPTPELCKLADPNAPCMAGQVNDAPMDERRFTLAEIEEEVKKGNRIVGYPKDRPPRYNGGVLCDVWVGPCACGATHKGADDVLEKR